MAISQETITRMMDAVGRDKFLAAFSKEEHLAALRKKELLDHLGVKRVLQLLINKLGRDELFKMLDQSTRR